MTQRWPSCPPLEPRIARADGRAGVTGISPFRRWRGEARGWAREGETKRGRTQAARQGSQDQELRDCTSDTNRRQLYIHPYYQQEQHLQLQSRPLNCIRYSITPDRASKCTEIQLVSVRLRVTPDRQTLTGHRRAPTLHARAPRPQSTMKFARLRPLSVCHAACSLCAAGARRR